MTDNAVRAHLTSLERDGLVQQSGLRQGSRKPHFNYELTADAEQLFPKSHAVILGQVLQVLEEKLPAKVTQDVLSEVGQRLAATHPAPASAKLEQRVQAAVQMLEELGGMAKVEKQDGHFLIRGGSCPLGDASCHHPGVCKAAEAMVAELVEAPVRECCIKGDRPKCCFEIDDVDEKKSSR